jgi:5-deoxy-D-glucuronate isomerase
MGSRLAQTPKRPSAQGTKMIALCPLVTINQDGAIKACIQPINPEFHTYARGHLEQVETLGELCERMNATNEYGNNDAIVVSVRGITNVFCGGEVRYQVLIAKEKMHRFEKYQTHTVYLSDDKGALKVAIPA